MSQPNETPRRYTPAQLARLIEISSAIKCECPNHLSRIVQSLIAFEDYARDCANSNADDARIHGMLHAVTTEARVLLDQALAEVVAFEKIEI